MFTNLHAHDHGSLLDGAGTPEQRALVAKELGQDSLAITNHGNLITAPDHIKACNNRDIKPIVGIEAYFKPDRLRQDNEHKKSWHLLLLAQNQQGFDNLIKLSSEGHQSGFYYKPVIDWELLKKYSEGVICSSACISGYISHKILENDTHEVAEAIERHLDIFGDNFYLELMPHDVPAQKQTNLALVDLSYSYHIPLVATGDSHYPYKNWKDTQDIILMISTGQTRSERKKKREAGEDVYEMDVPLHMFSEDEMYELFAKNHKDLPKEVVERAIDQSQIIADSVEPVQVDQSPKLPRISESESVAEKTLRKWCVEGLNRVGKEDDQEYLDRLELELETIKDFGVTDYFVLVAKMIRFARKQKIRISSGRGSAAGSLVCYLTTITMVDPIAHKLLFERFMNPNRKGLPDIDIDFDPQRREEVISFIKNEVGEDHVAFIGSFGTYHPKGALKDVGRVMNISFQHLNAVSAVIPEAKDVGGQGNVPPLSVLKDENGFIKDFAEKYPEVWKHATRIEGQIKQLGKHAAGVVVTDKPITEYVPLLHGKTDIVTAWSSRAESDIISDMGLLKIDILSLDFLTKQGQTVEMIKQLTGEEVDLDSLPVATDPSAADPNVMKIFQKGLTLGVFQFGGSTGITNFLKKVKPDKFEDLVAVNALYRTGPLEGGDAYKFADIKNGDAPVEYWHETVIPYLEDTYGVMAFQEQLQQIVQALGNFSPGDSDDMRKATSKLYRMGKIKARQFMADYKEKWTKGCKEHGLNEAQADHIWERLIAFGAYSFNRSHSTSYSLAGYQDAYLKTYYPQPFYASLLTDEEYKKVEPIIREAKQLGVLITPPDINVSGAEFTVTGEKLLYGLESVKYVGQEAVREILANRPYESYEDFCGKVTKKKVNKRVKESLVKSGAFDNLGMRDEVRTKDKRDQEIEVLGVAISGAADLDKYKDLLEERCNSEEEFELMSEGSGLTVGGEVVSVKPIKIKRGKNKGKNMAFVNLSYQMNQYNLTFFNDKYEKYEHTLAPGNILIIRGRKDDRGSVLVDKLVEAEKLKAALNE